VVHIQHPDEFPSTNADGNIIRKVLRACLDTRITEKFLFINDDHVLLRPIKVQDIPPFHKGDMKELTPHYFSVNPWRKRLHATKLALEAQDLPTLHFDCHTPILFEKEKFIDAMARFDYASGIGLTMKSLYGNVYHEIAPLLAGEKKVVFSFYNLAQLESKFKYPFFLSYNDLGLNDSLKVFLYQKFREPSPFETLSLQDRTIDTYIAARECPSYQFMTETFIRHFKNTNIKSLLFADRNSRFENKLKYLFEQKLTDL
jgi:hypothetical protein